MDDFKILSDIVSSVWTIFTVGFGVGYAICKLSLPKNNAVTTIKEFCNVPQAKVLQKIPPQEFTKTFINDSGKVVDVTCVHMDKGRICKVNRQKCKHYC